MKASELLSRALEEFDERGWGTGELLDIDSGHVCALGALGCAAGLENDMRAGSYVPFHEIGGDPDILAALGELYPVMPGTPVDEFDAEADDFVTTYRTANNDDDVYEWNDASTEERVREVFNKALDTALAAGK
jgi:hypothetical protein